MSKENWGLWAEEKEPEPELVPVTWLPNDEREVAAEYSIKMNSGGFLTGFGVGLSAAQPAIRSYLDSIQAFSRPMRGISSGLGDVRIMIDSEMVLDTDMLEKMILRMPKPREASPKLKGWDSRFFIMDECSSFEEVKPNWTESRGLKGKGFQPKKQNNPKGNPVYGTTWRKK